MATPGRLELAGIDRAEHGAMQRRRDIDGLRAVAVLGVVAYHYGFGVPGGYGGVDIFFVISGFLIAGILIGEIGDGSFSFTRFYERRIRRIFPALCVCLLATLIASIWLLFPNDFRPFGKSLLAAVISTSNFYFASQQGYFDASAMNKPLLHTWSLSIEEQFYLVFPLALYLLLTRSRKISLGVFALMAAASLAYSDYLVDLDPARAFFSTPGRIWELLAGVLLALVLRPQKGGLPAPARAQIREQRAPYGRALVELEAAAGLACILYAYFAFSDETAFPGLAALPFCVGAVLVIHSGSRASERRTAVARLLSTPPFVAIGLISYSLYLWHWPLLIFAHYRFPEWFASDFIYRPLVGTVLFIVSLVLSALSWRYVEQPFRRRGRSDASARPVFVRAGAAAAVFAAFAITANGAGNVLQRWPADFYAMMKFRKPVPAAKCAPLAAGDELSGQACRIGRGEADTILWGDSHASALFPVFARHSEESGRGIIVAARPGCPPLDGVTLYGRGVDASCGSHNASVIDRALKPDVRRVIIASRWAFYAEGTTSEDGAGAADRISPSRDQTTSAFEKLLTQTVKRLSEAGREVIIVGPVPENAFDVRAAVARHRVWQKDLPRPLGVEAFQRRERFVLPLLQRLGQLANVRIVYPHDQLCNRETCDYMRDGVSLYDDSNHLSIAGASSLMDIVRQAFAPAISASDTSQTRSGRP